MTLREFVGVLLDLLYDHWTKLLTAIVVFWLGRALGKRRAKADWSKREFLGRLMISLNSLQRDDAAAGAEGKPKLAIRTLLEKNVDEVLLNSVAVDRVLEAAKKTTEADPILPLEKDDRWLILNAVLNEVAERFAVGTLSRDLGLPVESKRYLICLTNEVAGPVRTRKIRAMVVQQELLLSGAFEGDVRLEAESHVTRLDTLKKMRERFAREPDMFLQVDLTVAR